MLSISWVKQVCVEGDLGVVLVIEHGVSLSYCLQVKVVCQFKGREMDFKDLAFKLFQRFSDDIGEVYHSTFLRSRQYHS